MTTQEAIEIIKKDGWGYPENMHTEAVMMAIDALEKRTPKKPDRIRRLIDTTEEEPEIIMRGNCHSCGRNVDMDIHRYCPSCGQRLDWSEVEE